MQIARQWSAAELSGVSPRAAASQALKTYCGEVKGLMGANANANEFSFNSDQVCLHSVNSADGILIRFNQQTVMK